MVMLEPFGQEYAPYFFPVLMFVIGLLVPVRDNSAPLITTSIGVALAPANTQLDLDDLIEVADVALYSAKRAGRDRVEIVEAGDATESQEAGSGERRRA